MSHPSTPSPAGGVSGAVSGVISGAISSTVVIKVGSSSIVDVETGFVALGNLSRLVERVCELKRKGHRVVLVTSGAVGLGVKRMGWQSRPKTMAKVQVQDTPCLWSLVSGLCPVPVSLAVSGLSLDCLCVWTGGLFCVNGEVFFAGNLDAVGTCCIQLCSEWLLSVSLSLSLSVSLCRG